MSLVYSPSGVVALHSSRLDFNDSAEVLRGNTFGILESDLTLEDKLARLVALVPMALAVVDEARSTIQRLREENNALREEINAAGGE